MTADYDPSRLIPSQSSNVAGFYFEPDPESLIGSGTLFVAFHSGAVYRYHPCPDEIYDQLFAAGSKGRALN